MVYTPRSVPQFALNSDTADLAQFLDEEHRTIARSLQEDEQIQYTVLSVAPKKPRQGMTVVADGTHWNPGSGSGLYLYIGSGWRFVG